MPTADSQQYDEYGDVEVAVENIRLLIEVVVNHACDSAQINQPVQSLPSRASEPDDPPFGGGRSEWEHRYQRDHARYDERPLRDVLQNLVPEEFLVDEVCGHV